MEQTITLPLQGEISCDVLVAGGGVAGCCAALAAARRGQQVILMDECGVLGGQGSQGLVAPIAAIKDRNGASFGGIMQEILDQVKAQCPPSARENAQLSSPAMLGLVLLEMLHQANVQVHFFTTLLSVERQGRMLDGVIASTKSGLRRYLSKMFIDATGDGDLFARAGEEFVIGSEPGVFQTLAEAGMGVHFEHSSYHFPSPGAVQPVSIMFEVGGVVGTDCEKYCNKRFTYSDLGITREDYAKFPFAGQVGFEENGDLLPLPQGRFLFFRAAREGEYTVNMSRVTGINGADADSLNRGELYTQLQVLPILQLLRRFIPGFENAYLISAGTRLGVRESRRLKSRRVLSGAEALYCTPLNDVIAHGSYIIDIHDPHGKSMAIGGSIKGCSYDIPYGALLPRSADNLLVCGRCIGSDHVAHSTTRIMGTCMLTGQAAGTAAALCIEQGVKNGELDVSALQTQLVADGVKLHLPGDPGAKALLHKDEDKI